MEKTPQQIEIISAASTTASMMVSAYAGTGKTTTISMLAASLPRRPTLALAFNKRIAEELTPRLPADFTVKTLNGLGHGALIKATGRKMIVDSNKVGTLVTKVIKESGYKDETSREDWNLIRSLVSKAKSIGLVPSGLSRPAISFIPDEDDVWENMADDLYATATKDHILLCRKILHENINLALSGTIDFDDQIYISVCINGVYTRYGNVIVDEAQDLSPLNHAQIKRSLLPDAKLIVVGDPKQAIYAFRGADSSSMEKLRALREDWIDLPLSVTFRCPRSIVARQQEHAVGYVAAEQNEEGEVVDLRGKGWDLKDSLDSTAVLCRNNAPLLALAMKLIRDRVPCKVLGTDIGKNLTALLKKICGNNPALPAADCCNKIRDWGALEIRNAAIKGKDEKISAIMDRQECLLAILTDSSIHDLHDAIIILADLFGPSAAKITLSSGHKAKGLEWKDVIFLDPWRIPSKYAIVSNEHGNPSPLEQEKNLKYVIETRAKQILVLANLEDYGEEEAAMPTPDISLEDLGLLNEDKNGIDFGEMLKEIEAEEEMRKREAD